MATHASMAITAKRNALRKATTVQGVNPTPAPGGAPGVMVTTYTCARYGLGRVVARLLNSNGMVTAYRVLFNNIPYTVPAGNLAAIGTCYVPYSHKAKG